MLPIPFILYRHVVHTMSECGCFDTVFRVAQHKTMVMIRLISDPFHSTPLVFHTNSIFAIRFGVSGSSTFGTPPTFIVFN